VGKGGSVCLPRGVCVWSSFARHLCRTCRGKDVGSALSRGKTLGAQDGGENLPQGGVKRGVSLGEKNNRGCVLSLRPLGHKCPRQSDPKGAREPKTDTTRWGKMSTEVRNSRWGSETPTVKRAQRWRGRPPSQPCKTWGVGLLKGVRVRVWCPVGCVEPIARNKSSQNGREPCEREPQGRFEKKELTAFGVAKC